MCVYKSHLRYSVLQLKIIEVNEKEHKAMNAKSCYGSLDDNYE